MTPGLTRCSFLQKADNYRMMRARSSVDRTISSPAACGRPSGRRQEWNYTLGSRRETARGRSQVLRYCKHSFAACGASGGCVSARIAFAGFYCRNETSLYLQFRTDEADPSARFRRRDSSSRNSAFPPELLLLSARWPRLRLGTRKFWKEREGNLTDKPADMERLRLKKV